MKLLVLTETYADRKNIYAQTYVHTRLLSYIKQGIEVEVVSFKCLVKYSFEGISVSPASSFKDKLKTQGFDAIICHAPNLRNHIRLLLLNFINLPYLFFIFHGHEMLVKERYYPRPFPFQLYKFYVLKAWSEKVYDYIKCFLLQMIVTMLGGRKLSMIFVSYYLKQLFLKNVAMHADEIKNFSTVIYNGLSEVFTNAKYDFSTQKPYDFITIRPFDKSVYAIDIVVQIAQQNPVCSFHIFGEGKYFAHNERPKNVKVFKRFLSPAEIAKKLNDYKAALMPSYHDSQGVMVCEMAAFGIPIVVSQIPATKEILSQVENRFFIDNQSPSFDAAHFLQNIKASLERTLSEDLSDSNTACKEIGFIKHELKKLDN